MIKTLKEFFEIRLLKIKENNTDTKVSSLELAAAVLMLEISLADSSIGDDERKVIRDSMTDHFHLSDEEAKDIIAIAEKEHDYAVSLHEFTSLINDSLSRQDRVKIIELLWRVAFADSVLDKYEEYFIRKIAGLLYVSCKDYIKAKHLASGE